ncbi:MAG TPA: tetratricopeptide repeat protein, partial [Gemmatimonadaceae bacterium]|nr:tetratricopeptide repeat protein [Gemmatimonadaceae bacterium]
MTRQLEGLPGVAASILVVALAPWAPLAGQGGLELKLSPESHGGGASAECPTLPRPAPPPPASGARAQAMARQALDATLVGNTDEARRLLVRAAALDPSSDELAYQLARAYEDGGQTREAVREYCRYLALGPPPSDSAEARQRIAALATPDGATVPERAAVQFRTGIAYVERGQLPEARHAFDAALAVHAPFAAAYYDRAFVNVRERQWAEAANDLERYAELAPGALDRVVAREQARVLRSAARSPSTAITVGLLPGGSQFYT